MIKNSCERCGKEFPQKSHYDSHNRHKTPCENNANKIKAVEEKLNFIDLCSGIGGFHFGFKKHKCVLACDVNKWCRESYETNFNIKCKEDIFELNVDELCDFDILCAGFPCQPFSSAGLKKGMKDDRSKVYDKIINIVLEKQPRIVLLENVKNLLVMNKGEVIKKIVSDLEKIKL